MCSEASSKALRASAASPSPRRISPRPACVLMSQVKKLRARPKVTWATSAWSKYLDVTTSSCWATLARSASESSTCLPETVICMRLSSCSRIRDRPPGWTASTLRPRSDWHGLLPFTLYRARNAQRSAVFGHGPAGDVHAFPSQDRHDRIIGEHGVGLLGAHHALDAEAYRLGTVAFPTGTRDGGGEEVFQIGR